MAERTGELLELADYYLQDPSLNPDQVRIMRSRAILRPLQRASPFADVAKSVGKSIDDLREFIRVNQKDYLAVGGVSSAEKDKVESEVGLFIKTCGAQIERLKNSVLAGQGQQGPNEPPGNSKPQQLNEQSAAHFHGVVLILAERLHRVSQLFDKCRAARYKQVAESEAWRKQQRQGAATNASTSGRQVETGSRGGWGSKSGGGQQQQQQVQEQLQEQDKELIAYVSSLSKSALGIERTMKEISTLNQMFSTAVLHQAEQIETIYMQAVDASHNIKVGNTSLVKTIEVNKSSSRYILVLLLVATLGLLFYDWFNS